MPGASRRTDAAMVDWLSMVHWNPIVAVHGINSLLILPALALAWRRRRLPSGLQVAQLMVAILLWVFFAFLEAWAVDPGRKTLWASFRYLGVAFTPLAYFRLSQEFGSERMARLKEAMVVLGGSELLVCLLAFTNESHHLLWTGYRIGRYGQMIHSHGPAYAGVLFLNYSLFLAASLRMVRAIFQFPHHYWRMGSLLLLAIAVPFVFSLAYTLKLSPPGIDPTPMGLSFTGLALAFGLLRRQLLDITPIARELLVEQMREGILVFDAAGRLVDYNGAAGAILGRILAIGELAQRLGPPWDRLALLFASDRDASLELSPQPGSWFEARVSRIQVVASAALGHMVFLYDIAARKEMESRLELLATRDSLTGLPNRRHFLDVLRRELSRCAREGQELCLLMLDVDHFKRINDTHGHAVGDRLLMRMGELLDGAIRGHDCAGRWGGEEFVVLMSGCSLETALERAEDWRRRIAQGGIPWEGETVRCTVSIGLAIYPFHGCDEDVLLSRCDAALYRSKREGRDRVSVAGSPEPQVARSCE